MLGLKLPLLEKHESHQNKDLLFTEDRVAIHSGKLGDIIYSLPTCRELGINHLVLNVDHDKSNPLRNMTLEQAQQIVPLLLKQPYLNKVTLTHLSTKLEEHTAPLEGIHYNLDQYRNVAIHRVNYILPGLEPSISKYSLPEGPIHLTQLFACSQGIQVYPEEAWLNIPPDPISEDKVIVSITRNWRTYPDWYWKVLLEGLDTLFVGHPSEFKNASLSSSTFIPSKEHEKLASLIQGCKLFLGTVSFPYAIAEALKVNRAVELCHWNLNAFPIGMNGMVLPVDVIEAREMISDLIPEKRAPLYNRLTKQLQKSPKVFVLRMALITKISIKTGFQKLLKKLQYYKNLHYFNSLHRSPKTISS